MKKLEQLYLAYWAEVTKFLREARLAASSSEEIRIIDKLIMLAEHRARE